MSTVPIEVPESRHAGDGTATNFLIGFELSDVTRLRVSVDGVLKTNPADYTVVADEIVFGTAPADEADILGWRVSPVQQSTEFQTQPTMKPLAVERAFNERALVDQELRAIANRALTVPIGEQGLTLPRVPERASSFLAFDEDGQLDTSLSKAEFEADVAQTAEDRAAAAESAADAATARTGAETAQAAAEAAQQTVEDDIANAPVLTLNKLDRDGSNPTDARIFRSNIGLTGQPQAQVMWARIRAEEVDVNWGVFSDSTGTGTDRHVYRTAVLLAADMPTHTVLYHAWNSGTLAWDTAVTIQNGSGARTFHVWNYAVSGTNLEYAEGGNRPVLLLTAPSYFDLVTINYGHNSGTDIGERSYTDEMRVAVALARSTLRDGGVLVTLQNPRRDTGGYAHTKRMSAAWRSVAHEYGCGVIDVLTPFEALGGAQATYYSDDIHPNSLGSALWAQIEYAGMRETKSLPLAPQAPNPMMAPRPNRCPNPGFATWTGAEPTGWTFTGSVPTKNPAKAASGAVFGLTATNTGTSPGMVVDLSSLLSGADNWRGETVTMHARVWKPAGMDALAGRVSLYANNGVLTPQSTSYQRSGSVGGWYDSIVSFTVPRDTAYNTLTGKIFLGSGAGDIGDQVHIAWVSVHKGVGPNVFDPAWVSGQAVTDLFNASAIGNSSGALSVVGNDTTITGISTTTIVFYHDLLTLETNRQYKVTWGSITGTGFTFGTMFARTGSGSGGGSGSIVTAAYSAGTLTFTAPGGACMLRFDVNGGTSTLSIPDLTITLVDEPVYLPVTEFRNDGGTVLDATGAAGNFKIAGTVGTSLYLQGEDAQNNTKTDAAWYEFTIPDEYVNGGSPVLIVNANYAVVSGAGTAGTKTIDAFVYELSSAGAASTDLCATAVQTLTTTAADYSFTITGTNLRAGERIQIRLLAVMQETANGGAFAVKINSVRLTGV